MNSFAAYFAPLALLLPAVPGTFAASSPASAPQRVDMRAHAAPENASPALGLRAHDEATVLRVLEDAHRPPPRNQVRIESRVIIRISPSPQAQRERMLAALPRRPLGTAYAEVEHGECVAIENITGVQPTDDERLLLFMRNRQVLSAALERTCSARSFYSGFYVERSGDGQLCVARDRLQSRSGDSCQVDTLHRLVAVRD